MAPRCLSAGSRPFHKAGSRVRMRSDKGRAGSESQREQSPRQKASVLGGEYPDTGSNEVQLPEYGIKI